MSIIGHKGIQVLSDINSVDDLPEVADVESEAVWYIESGDFAPDYIAPSFWDGEQFTEWISLVDGEVLVDIPDSVIYRWDPADFVESEDWIDEIKDQPMSNDGLSAITLSDGSPGVDGSDALGDADILTDVIQNEMTIEFAIETETADVVRFSGFSADGPDDLFSFEVNRDADANKDDGNLRLSIRDSDGNLSFHAFEDSPNVNDGERHTATIKIADMRNDDIVFYFDGEEKTTTVNPEGPDPDEFRNIDSETWGFFGNTQGGSEFSDADVAHGIIQFHDEAREPTLT